MAVMLRLECGSEDRESEVYGPFDYLQLTYSSLRADDGVHVVEYDAEAGEWRLSDDFEECRPEALDHVQFSAADKATWWSDIIIFEQKGR